MKNKGFSGAWNFLNKECNTCDEAFTSCFLFRLKERLKCVNKMIPIEDNIINHIAVLDNLQKEDLCHIGGKKLYHYICWGLGVKGRGSENEKQRI